MSSGRARDKVILSLMASAVRAERVLMIEVAWIELAWSKVGKLSKVRWPETRRVRSSTGYCSSEIGSGTGSNSISPLQLSPWGRKIGCQSWWLLRSDTNESCGHVMRSRDRRYRSLNFRHKWGWWHGVWSWSSPLKKKCRPMMRPLPTWKLP